MRQFTLVRELFASDSISRFKKTELSTQPSSEPKLTKMLNLSHTNQLVDTLKQLPKKMRAFSMSLQSLYVPNAIGTAVPQGKELEALRDATRLDAMIYNGGVQPLSTHVVLFIKEYFQNYTALTFDEWNESLKGILNDVQGYKQCCQVLVGMHEPITSSLEKIQVQAQQLAEKIKAITKSFHTEVEELEAEIAISFVAALFLLFVPEIGEIADNLFLTAVTAEILEKIVEMRQSEENDAAVHVLVVTLIPALQNFVGGLNIIAGVFENVEQDLISFIERGQGAEEDKKRHYLLMKNTGEEIQTTCQQFFAVIPEMTSDLEAIPSGDTEDCVKKWKKDQYAEISKKYKDDMTERLKQALAYLHG